MRKQSEQQGNLQEKQEHYYDQGPPLDEFQGDIAAIEGVKLMVAEYPSLLAAISDNDIQAKFYGIVRVRQTMYRGWVKEKHIKQIVYRIMHEANNMNFSASHYQAVITLSQLIQKKNSQLEYFSSCVVEAGGIPMFIRLLKSKKQEYISMAVNSIAIISYKTSQYLKEIRQQGGIQALIDLLNHTKKRAIIEDIYLAIGYMCLGDDKQACEFVIGYIPALIQIVVEQGSKQSEDIVELYKIIDKYGKQHLQQIEIYISQEFLVRLMKTIKKKHQIAVCSLSFLSNYVKLGQKQADNLISLGVIKHLVSANMEQLTEQLSQFYLLVTALACSEKNVRKIILQQELIGGLLLNFQMPENQFIYKIFSQFIIRGNSKLVFNLFHNSNIMENIANQLLSNNEQLEQFYEALYYALSLGDKMKIDGLNIFLTEFNEKGGINSLEQVYICRCESIFSWVRMIIDTFVQ